MSGILETSALSKSAFSAQLSPDELAKLAEAQIAKAMRIETGPERSRVLTVAGTLKDLAEIKSSC